MALQMLLVLLLSVWACCSDVSAQCPVGCDCPSPKLIKCSALNSLPETIPSTVQEAVFQSCTFSTIPSLPANYSNIRTLLIVNGSVSDINDQAFANMKQLNVLDITGNDLQHLKPEMFTGLQELDSLIMKNNDIHGIAEGLFSGLPALKTLSLQGNTKLILEDKSFNGCSLSHLNLDTCGLTGVPSFGGMTSLTHLQLGHNSLTTLDDKVFQGLNLLDKLELQSCQLTSIDDEAFEDLVQLRILDLAFNKLTSLDDHLFHDIAESLEELYLDNNLIESIHYHLLKDANSLTVLTLEGNPLICDCYIYWIRDAPISSESNTTCSSPDTLVGQNVKNVTTMMECPCDTGVCENDVTLYVVIPILIICSLLIICICIKIMLNRRKRAKRASVRYSEVYKDTTVTLN